MRSTTNCVNSASASTPSSSYNTLTYIDRAEFSDVNVALSFGGSAGQVAKVLGAVFGVYLLKIQYTQVLDMPVLTTTPRLRHFKKQGGPSAGSSFEQISMQRLTGVPSPISGGTGWVGSRWAGIWKGRSVISIFLIT